MANKESFFVNGENLLKKIKEIMSFPVNFAIVGAVLAPIFAAVGALAAVFSEYKITVEKDDKATDASSEESKGEQSS